MSTVTIPSGIALRLRDLLRESGRFDSADLIAALSAALAQADAPVTVRWVWAEALVHEIDRHPVVARGKALPLAFGLLAGAAYRLAPLPWAAVFPSSAAALQALDRAADQVRPISPTLAACIGCIGVRRGLFVLRRRLPARIEFSAPVIARAVNSP